MHLRIEMAKCGSPKSMRSLGSQLRYVCYVSYFLGSQVFSLYHQLETIILHSSDLTVEWRLCTKNCNTECTAFLRNVLAGKLESVTHRFREGFVPGQDLIYFLSSARGFYPNRVSMWAMGSDTPTTHTIFGVTPSPYLWALLVWSNMC